MGGLEREGDEPGLIESVWRYKTLVILTVLVATGAAFLWSVSRPTQYEGVVRVFLQAEEGSDPGRTVRSRAEFLKSPAVLDRTVALIDGRLTRKELEKRVSVEPSINADLITVRTLDSTPDRAAALADSVGLAYQQILTENAQESAKQRAAGLEQVQQRLADELTQLTKQLQSDPSNPSLKADEQAKRGQIEEIAMQKEQANAQAAQAADAAGLLVKAPLPEDRAEPRPLRMSALGAVIGLIGSAVLAWFLAGRRQGTSPERYDKLPASQGNEELDDFFSRVDDELVKANEVLRDVVDRRRSEAQGASESRGVPGLDNDGEPERSEVFATSLSVPSDSATQVPSMFQNLPQTIAKQVSVRFPVDTVAVLLAFDDGLEVAGRVGAHMNGLLQIGHYDRHLLGQLDGQHARLLSTSELPELLQAVTSNIESKQLIVAPLKHQGAAFGVLLAGQGTSNGTSRLGTETVEGIGSFARDTAAELHAWLLLQRLRDQRGLDEYQFVPEEEWIEPPRRPS